LGENSVNTSYALTDYVLGSNEAEHERLTRQAGTLAPYTERLFRAAGMTIGQSVLDVGSGVGDVALLASALVGRSGSVLGIDRDSMALTRARSRATVAGASNVRFIEADLTNLQIDGDFDAIVGRFILMFLPDPVATLRSLAKHLRPGGVIVFQEASWASFFAHAQNLPLRTACGELLCGTFRRAGARPDMPLALFQGLLDSGFSTPSVHVEVPIANDAGGHRWLPELIATLRPRFRDLGLDTGPVGDFDTLYDRLEMELDHARSYAPLAGLVGAWARKPW
jgi:ubiquinone/menaquinone biosynthesis C-methylase UbiE